MAAISNTVVADETEVVVTLPEMEDSNVNGNKATKEKAALSSKLDKKSVDDNIAECEPGRLLKFLLCAVAALEGSDNLLMPATMFALQDKAGIKFTDLVYLGGIQAVCTNIAAPLWGMLADRGTLSRRNILIVGSLGQGLVTVLLAFVTDLTPMVFLRGMNGVMLASLRPISNGVVADTTSDGLRGKIFGQVQAALILGMLFTSVVATPIARQDIYGIQGWRVAFVIVGSLSLVVCVLLKLFFVDPVVQADRKASKGFQAVVDEIKNLCGFFKIPTFSVMIMQGIFGTIPWAVLGYMTLYFQLAGLPDWQATILQTEQLIVGIAGNMLGGYVADALARRLGYHGRPLNAQLTVSMGLPLIAVMFWGIPAGEGDFAVYFVLLFLWALSGCWAQSGTNFPILCDLVPQEARCRILAWECCLENTIANALAPPIVAHVATELGYTFGKEAEKGEELKSAQALGASMVIINTDPGLICLAAYSLLHLTYPRDMSRSKSKPDQTVGS
jgi:predicted MFS family arabinose efflux permease